MRCLDAKMRRGKVCYDKSSLRANAKQSSETVITRSDERRSNPIHNGNNNEIATFRYTPLAMTEKRLRNKCAMTCDLSPRPFGERVRERGYLAASLPSRLAAFTLAEVLITLGIIGVVAAMTMPSLVASYQKQQVVAQLKKAYTELSQTLKMAEAENGPIDSWDVTSMNKSQEGADLFANTFLVPYIKTIKTCFPSTSECWADDVYNLNGSKVSYLGNNRAEFNSFVTVSGYSVYYWLNSDGRGGWLWVDLNGPKKPNIIGKDVFAFTMRWISSSPAGAVSCERKLGVSMIGATCKAETSPRDGLFSGNFTNGVSDYKCKKGAGGSWAGTYCGALIMQDGWTISKDYPW